MEKIEEKSTAVFSIIVSDCIHFDHLDEGKKNDSCITCDGEPTMDLHCLFTTMNKT